MFELLPSFVDYIFHSGRSHASCLGGGVHHTGAFNVLHSGAKSVPNEEFQRKAKLCMLPSPHQGCFVTIQMCWLTLFTGDKAGIFSDPDLPSLRVVR